MINQAELHPRTSLQNLKEQSGLYAFIWRWHFYASLILVPFILVFAVTGSMYLFKSQFEGWFYQNIYNVPESSQKLSPDIQLQQALTRFPGSKPEAFVPSITETRSSLVRLLTADGQKLTVGVNPHTGNILGTINNRQKPMQFIRDLHGKLLLGKTGEAIQELAASWAMILVITGLYLWWPRRGAGIGGTFLPRLQVSGRIFWRDLHAVTGFWVSGLLVFLIVTGLPWSVISGEMIHYAAAHIGKGSPKTGVGWDGSGSKFIKSTSIKEDWVVEHAQKLAGSTSSEKSNNIAPLPLSQILQITQTIPRLQTAFEIRMPVDKQGVYSIVTDHDSPPEKVAYIHIDQYSGKVIKDIRWHDFGPLAQSISLGVALHEGRYFGWPNQLLGLIACLGLMTMVVAGVAMWWKRRPKGTLGAPVVPKNYRMGPFLLGLIFVLSLLMPLMGLSLIIIGICDWTFQNILKRKRYS
jgi:uncharacterized iron-regulated membrane protein